MHAQHRWSAMGTWAHVVVDTPDPADAAALLALARERVEALEALWSRFRPGSDVSRANARRGTPTPVAPETVRLVRLAAVAATELAPYFDPCQLDDILAWGYDRTFAYLDPVTAAPVRPADTPEKAPTAGLAAGDDWIRVPASGFDPGAIGKGLAADLVAEELRAAGATGALVNIGGDLRCVGVPPAELAAGAWTVEVTDEHDVALLLLHLGEGGVATSSSRRRQWVTVAGPAHHLLDPRTGAPVQEAARSVTVLSDRGWRAEALATAVLVAGVERGRALVEHAGAAAFVLDAGGGRHHLGALDAFLRYDERVEAAS